MVKDIGCELQFWEDFGFWLYSADVEKSSTTVGIMGWAKQAIVSVACGDDFQFRTTITALPPRLFSVVHAET